MFRKVLFQAVTVMALALALPLTVSAQVSYGPDLTTTGAAIECGHSGSSTPDRAFDDNNATGWFSSQTGASVAGAACVGQDFGSGNAYHIRQFTIKQSDATHCVSSVIVQNSSNGSSWVSAETVAVSCDGTFHAYALASSGAYRYWRILGNSAVSGSNTWGILELEMMEAYSFPTNTPGPTNTPTITPTPTVTPTPTATNTPDYFIVATFAGATAYPITVRPTATMGEISVTGVGIVLTGVVGLFFVSWLVRRR